MRAGSTPASRSALCAAKPIRLTPSSGEVATVTGPVRPARSATVRTGSAASAATTSRSRWPMTPSALSPSGLSMGTAAAGVTTAMSARPARSAASWSLPPRPDQMANCDPSGDRSPISWASQPQIRCMFAWPQSPRNARVTGRPRRGSSATGEHLPELGGAERVVDLGDGVEREADPLELLLDGRRAVRLVHRDDEPAVGVDVELAEGRVDVLSDLRAVARHLFG